MKGDLKTDWTGAHDYEVRQKGKEEHRHLVIER